MTLQSLKKGDIVKAVVTGADEKGVQVKVQGIAATIKKADLSKENNDPLSYKEGDILEAKLTSVDRKNAKLGVSVKAYELEEEKKAIEEYSANGSAGSSLGEALGEALKNKE
jgi:small subunit ribosomal protein S1